MARFHPGLQPYRPTAQDPFDRVKAAHLLNRAGFGGTAAEIEQVLELGPQQAAQWLLDFPDAGAEQQGGGDMPDLSSLEGYPRTFAELRRIQQDKDEEDRRMFRQMLQRANGQAIRQTAYWWLRRMALGPHSLQEKLALFWHGHFTTSAQDTRSANMMWQQNELLRRMAAGNFRQFVHAIARDPAMLSYLNNNQNRRQRPNENFARELMELFTLGIGNYTEQDVKEAARAFTGWSHNGDDFVFNRGQHDPGEKTFLGRTGSFGGEEVVDIIIEQPACAPYIAGRLFRFFAYEDPDEALVQALGDVLREADYELRPLLRAILTSRAFYGDKANATQFKSPIQLLVGTLRTLEMEIPPSQALAGALRQMGQVPFYPPNVQGWPGGRSWVNSSTLFVRYNTAVQLVGRVPAEAFRPDGNDTEAIADVWLERLIQRPIGADKRQVLLDALGDDPPRPQAVRRMVQLIVSMPEYQVC